MFSHLFIARAKKRLLRVFGNKSHLMANILNRLCRCFGVFSLHVWKTALFPLPILNLSSVHHHRV